MPRFLRKPVVVEGWQFVSYSQVIERQDLPPWVAQLCDAGRLVVWQDHAEVKEAGNDETSMLYLQLGWWLISDPYRGLSAFQDVTSHFDPYDG